MIKITLKNRGEVLRAVARVERNIVVGVAQAVLDGAAGVAAEARRRAPVDTGALRASIVTKATHLKDGTPAAKVFTPLFYARFVEFGTRGAVAGQAMLDGTGKNWSKKKSKRKRVKGFEVRVARRTHPGSKARPFLFPAYRARKKAIQSSVSKAIVTGARKAA